MSGAIAAAGSALQADSAGGKPPPRTVFGDAPAVALQRGRIRNIAFGVEVVVVRSSGLLSDASAALIWPEASWLRISVRLASMRMIL